VAVLGILILNIQAFSMPWAAYANPTAYGDLSGPNLWVWVLSHVFAEQKFISIFSMLFGAGVILMTSKGGGEHSAGVHYRRMGWLILFGLLHAHLLWFGDILYTYGVCGLIVYLFRKLSPGPLIAWSIALQAVSSGLFVLIGTSMLQAPPEAVGDIERQMRVTPEAIQRELAAYRGGWLDQQSIRSGDALNLETQGFLLYSIWKVLGLMLLGMALFKMGVFSAARSTTFYIGLVAIGLLVGVPVVSYGVYQNFAAGWDVRYSGFLGTQFNYWASIIVALGWVGAVMLACKTQVLQRATSVLADVGRMAFTNYILQTLICTTIFYGHGLGLFGYVDRVGQIGVVLAVWAFELVMSPWWLRRFAFGPMEWLWRSLTYWQLQPMRRAQAGT
jgi:uncharacterized protein